MLNTINVGLHKLKRRLLKIYGAENDKCDHVPVQTSYGFKCSKCGKVAIWEQIDKKNPQIMSKKEEN